MHVIISGLLIEYGISGSGKTVVLLHGWGDNRSTFNSLSKKLAKNFEVVGLDLPGFGNSQTPKTTWDLNTYAEFITIFLSKIDKKPFVIIGHSNGGAIAIRSIAITNISPKKLILLASSGIRDENKGRKKMLMILAKMAKTATILLPRNVQQGLKTRAYRTIGSDMFVVEHLQETFKNIITDDVRKDAENIQIPTLLVYGIKDKATPVRHGKILNNILPHSSLITIEGAGHFLHHDKPELVADAILDFLR